MCRIQEPGEAVYLTILPLYLNTCIDVPHTRTRGSSLPDNITPIFEYMYRCAAYKNQGKQST